ncbi:MAG: ArsR/SmtB family transcription factor [Candidatus Bathyarchaeia archaeon]
MRKPILVIKDPEVAKLLADKTRRSILRILRHHEMSTTDLAKSLDKSHSSISHHLNHLLEAGLVEETRVEKVRNMVQPYYKSTARHFHVSYTLNEIFGEDSDYVAWREGLIQEMLEGLKSFNINIPEQQKGYVQKLIDTAYTKQKKAFEEAVEAQTEVGNVNRHTNRGLIRLIANINLSKDPEHAEAIEELARIFEECKDVKA